MTEEPKCETVDCDAKGKLHPDAAFVGAMFAQIFYDVLERKLSTSEGYGILGVYIRHMMLNSPGKRAVITKEVIESLATAFGEVPLITFGDTFFNHLLHRGILTVDTPDKEIYFEWLNIEAEGRDE